MTLHARPVRITAQGIYLAALPAMGLLPQAALRLSDMRSDLGACSAAIAEELRHEPGLDAKGCGAYLVNRLGYVIGRGVAALDLSGHDLCALDPASTGVVSTLTNGEYAGEIYHYLDTKVTVTACAAGAVPDAQDVARIYVALFDPLVEGVSAACTLGRGALWRLVTDGIAAAYLDLGEEAGETTRAVARAKAILMQPDTRLYARQLNFLTLTLPAAENPLGKDITRIFRERAGCCRYYTTPRSGGEYCNTCIHRKDRPARFRREMLRRAHRS